MKTSPNQNRRFLGIASVVVAGFIGLNARLADLQIFRHEEFRIKALVNREKTIIREPARGDILDTKGDLLATSVFVKTICANPELILTNQTIVARTLAPLLNLDEAALAERLQRRERPNPDTNAPLTRKTLPVEYVVLKRKVREEDWLKIKHAMLKLDLGLDESKLSAKEKRFLTYLRGSAIFPDRVEDQLREYPNKVFASHVLGYVGMEKSASPDKPILRSVGRDGIEKTVDHLLSGVYGWRELETDRKERELVAFREQDVAPKPGHHVVLTIDSGVQEIVETALDRAMQRLNPLSVGVIVVEPSTGRILAMGGRPSFDPNHPGNAATEVLRNRLISDSHEPGSTFKIAVVSGGLSDRIVTPQDQFNCENGRFFFAGKWLHDDHHYGLLTVQEIISKSSNIGAAKIAIMMGDARLRDHVTAFGFGSKTGIPLPGEVSGIVHPLSKWTKLSISRIPMGHEVASTPLQTTMAMAAIANGGRLMRPMLIDRIIDVDGNIHAQFGSQIVRQVISPTAAKQMVESLRLAVAPGGTGTKASLEHYSTAGKTGTARKAGPGGYLPGKYFSSFIGFFPSESPRVCIGVFFDEPKTAGNAYYGGTSAGPVFKEVGERTGNYLNIRPSPAPQISAGSSMAVGGITKGITRNPDAVKP